MKNTALLTSAVVLMFFMAPAAALDLDLKAGNPEYRSNENYLVGSAGDVLYEDWNTGEGLLACTAELGWVCLDVQDGDTITINDDSTLDVAAFSPQLGPFCGSIDVADHDGHVDLFLTGPAFHAIDGCFTDGGPATMGTVTVS